MIDCSSLTRRCDNRLLFALALSTTTCLAAGCADGLFASQSQNDDGQDIAVEADAATELTEVERRDLVETYSLTGLVSYGDPVPLALQVDDRGGVVTWAPDQGAVISSGEAIIHIDDVPIPIVTGDQAMYRELRLVGQRERDVAGDKLGLQVGDDVRQLQEFLVSQGFNDDGQLEADGAFGKSTKRAVESWQTDIGRPATGRVDRSQIVFSSGPVRVEDAPNVGQLYSEMTVTSPKTTLSISVAPTKRSFFDSGSEVTIETEIEDSPSAIGGVVDSVTRTVQPDGSTTFVVVIEPSKPLTGVEAAKATSEKLVATNVTAIPVRALISLAEGGWAIETHSDDGVEELVGVELGPIVDGWAEVDGVEEGTAVVIPR